MAAVTSVKEFRIEEPPTETALGRGAFVFTDDYSVFDWGKMPDEIPEKGQSLCTMGAFNFELLEDAGIPTHYRGVIDPAGADDPVSLADVEEPPREMAIELTTVPDLPNEGLDYDYDHYHDEAGDHFLIPLEVVFRNRVPKGSSLRRRTEPTDHGLDVESWPAEAVDLEEPIVEYSTKYEERDRYLTDAEADAIAGPVAIEDLAAVARQVNRLLTDQAASVGLDHQDGKIECLYADGEIHVADVVGTFDENRFSYEDVQLSKEVLRQYHKRTQPEWVGAVDEAKASADREGVADWKARCDRAPEPLADRVLDVARNVYCSGTNTYTETEWFEAPPLSSAIGAVGRL